MRALFEVVVAGAIRYALIVSEYRRPIASRVELSTPLNCWRRLVEGVHLYDEGVDPYEGDVFHESPLVLVAFHALLKRAPSLVPLAFVALDLVTALALYATAIKFAQTIEAKNAGVSEQSRYALTAYLFNPYSILNCVATTTSVVDNALVALALLAMVRGRRSACCVAIALAAHRSLYPGLLIVPAAIFVHDSANGCAKCSYIKTLTLFVLAWGALVFGSAYAMDGSYRFLENTYGFILNVPDLKPNIGLFWYFFTEMFEHFRLFFMCTFQINASLLYIIPLTLRFKDEPLLLATTIITLTTIFKSYPSLGDVALYLAIVPMWKHLFSYMQQKFIVTCFFLVTSALGPAVWHLWIYSRSANANFFFGVTLTFATAQIFLITDLLFAYIRYEHDMKHGDSREIDGKPAKLVLW